MSSSRPPLSSRPAFLPSEIAQREFGTVFRGYDPAEVRTFLNQLSEQATETSDVTAELQIALTEAESRASNPELTEELVTSLLGEQTAHILRSAREAAAEMRAKADEEVNATLRDSHEAAARMRTEAETVLAERTKEAEQSATSIRNDALATAEATRSAARDDADRIRSDAQEYADQKRLDADNEEHDRRTRLDADVKSELENARTEARELISLARAEAQALVERTRSRQDELLESLVRKRKIALAQVEELRAGRERLLEAYRMVRGTLDDVTSELERVEDEARQQALAAGQRTASASGIEGGDLDEVVEMEEIPHTDDVPAHVINLVNAQDTDENESKSQSTSDPEPSLHDVLYRSNTIETDHREVPIIDAEAEPTISLVDQEARSEIVTRAHAQLMRRIHDAMREDADALVERIYTGDGSTAESLALSLDDQSAFYQRCVIRGFRETVASAEESAAQHSGVEIPSETVHADQLGAAHAREFGNDITGRIREISLPTIEALLAETQGEYGPAHDVIKECIDAVYREVTETVLTTLLSTHLERAFDSGSGLVEATSAISREQEHEHA